MPEEIKSVEPDEANPDIDPCLASLGGRHFKFEFHKDVVHMSDPATLKAYVVVLETDNPHPGPGLEPTYTKLHTTGAIEVSVGLDINGNLTNPVWSTSGLGEHGSAHVLPPPGADPGRKILDEVKWDDYEIHISLTQREKSKNNHQVEIDGPEQSPTVYITFREDDEDPGFPTTQVILSSVTKLQPEKVK